MNVTWEVTILFIVFLATLGIVSLIIFKVKDNNIKKIVMKVYFVVTIVLIVLCLLTYFIPALQTPIFP